VLGQSKTPRVVVDKSGCRPGNAHNTLYAGEAIGLSLRVGRTVKIDFVDNGLWVTESDNQMIARVYVGGTY